MQPLERPRFRTETGKRIYQYVERHGTAARHRTLSALDVEADEFQDELEWLVTNGYLEDDGGTLRVDLGAGSVERHESDGTEYAIRPARQEDFEGVVDAIRRELESVEAPESVAVRGPEDDERAEGDLDGKEDERESERGGDARARPLRPEVAEQPDGAGDEHQRADEDGGEAVAPRDEQGGVRERDRSLADRPARTGLRGVGDSRGRADDDEQVDAHRCRREQGREVGCVGAIEHVRYLRYPGFGVSALSVRASGAVRWPDTSFERRTRSAAPGSLVRRRAGRSFFIIFPTRRADSAR